ncbi:hypothetical protein MJO28_016483 [Puccinia striiformis f. sp. tritici]|uniref:Uncharacterized protein n=1 Tax=Puccinia striiformis f. sp. tritici TaxID=168172 RepID=A0ACC0DNG8_9BASI|nr:hypothetical protein MJO28_016483 [Puccinia striiformis f. sp. tritici]
MDFSDYTLPSYHVVLALLASMLLNVLVLGMLYIRRTRRLNDKQEELDNHNDKKEELDELSAVPIIPQIPLCRDSKNLGISDSLVTFSRFAPNNLEVMCYDRLAEACSCQELLCQINSRLIVTLRRTGEVTRKLNEVLEELAVRGINAMNEQNLDSSTETLVNWGGRSIKTIINANQRYEQDTHTCTQINLTYLLSSINNVTSLNNKLILWNRQLISALAWSIESIGNKSNQQMRQIVNFKAALAQAHMVQSGLEHWHWQLKLYAFNVRFTKTWWLPAQFYSGLRQKDFGETLRTKEFEWLNGMEATKSLHPIMISEENGATPCLTHFLGAPMGTQFFNWEVHCSLASMLKGQDGIIIEIICLFNGGRLNGEKSNTGGISNKRKVNQGHPLGGIVRPGATSSGESVGSIIPNGSFDSCLLTASTIYPEHCMLGNGRACKHNATKRGAKYLSVTYFTVPSFNHSILKRFDYFEKLTAPFSFHLHMESPDNANSIIWTVLISPIWISRRQSHLWSHSEKPADKSMLSFKKSVVSSDLPKPSTPPALPTQIHTSTLSSHQQRFTVVEICSRLFKDTSKDVSLQTVERYLASLQLQQRRNNIADGRVTRDEVKALIHHASREDPISVLICRIQEDEANHHP